MDRLASLAQGGQDILRTTVLALREPLAQLVDDQARNPVALQPAKQLLLAGGELDALQVPTHLRRQALPQKVQDICLLLSEQLASDGTAAR